MKTFSKYLLEATDYYFKDLNYDKLSIDKLSSFMNVIKEKGNEIKKLSNEYLSEYDKMYSGMSPENFVSTLKKLNELCSKCYGVVESLKKSDDINLVNSFNSMHSWRYLYPGDVYSDKTVQYRKDFSMWKLFFAKLYALNLSKDDIVKLKNKVCDVYDLYRSILMDRNKIREISYGGGISNYSKLKYDVNVGDSFNKVIKNTDFYEEIGSKVYSNLYIKDYSNKKQWEFIYGANIGWWSDHIFSYGNKIVVAIVYVTTVNLATGKVTSVKKYVGTRKNLSIPWNSNKVSESYNIPLDTLLSIAGITNKNYQKFIAVTPNRMMYPPVNFKTGQKVQLDHKGRHPNDPHYMEDDYGYLPGNPYYNPTGMPMVYD